MNEINPKSIAACAFKGVPRKRGKPYEEKNVDRDLGWIEKVATEQKKVAERMSVLTRTALPACPICASEKFSPFITVHSFQYSECQSCGHFFIDSPPDPEAISKLYVGDSELHCCQSIAYNEDTFLKRLEFITRPKVAFVREHIDPALKDGTAALWVDIGCAFGEMLVAASELGWRGRGIEADSAQSVEARRRGLEVLDGYVTPENAKSYLQGASVVSAINCIEHIPDPVSLLQSINIGLTSPSFLVVEVPRQPSIGAFANFVYPQFLYRQFCAPDHLHLFTERSLEILFERTGFEAVAVWSFGKDAVDFISQAALSAGDVSNSAKQFFDQIITIAAKSLQGAIDQADLSDTLFVIAKKKKG